MHSSLRIDPSLRAMLGMVPCVAHTPPHTMQAMLRLSPLCAPHACTHASNSISTRCAVHAHTQDSRGSRPWFIARRHTPSQPSVAAQASQPAASPQPQGKESSPAPFEDESQYGFDFDSGTVAPADAGALPAARPLFNLSLPAFGSFLPMDPPATEGRGKGYRGGRGGRGARDRRPLFEGHGTARGEGGALPEGVDSTQPTEAASNSNQQEPVGQDDQLQQRPQAQAQSQSDSQAQEIDFEARLDDLFGPAPAQRTRTAGSSRAVRGRGSRGPFKPRPAAAHNMPAIASQQWSGEDARDAQLDTDAHEDAEPSRRSELPRRQQPHDIIKLDEHVDDSNDREAAGSDGARRSGHRPWWQLSHWHAARFAPQDFNETGTGLSPLRDGGAAYQLAGNRDSTLFVKGLDSSAPEALIRAALAAAFAQAGRVVQIRLPSMVDSRGERELKGIAYIVFQNPVEKEQALELKQICVLGRQLVLDGDTSVRRTPNPNTDARNSTTTTTNNSNSTSTSPTSSSARMAGASTTHDVDTRARSSARSGYARYVAEAGASSTQARQEESQGEGDAAGDEPAGIHHSAPVPAVQRRLRRSDAPRSASAPAPEVALTPAAVPSLVPAEELPAPKRKGRYLA